MKVFNFDPITGKRGELIDNRKIITWTGQGVEYQVKNNIIEPIECVLPKSNDSTNYTLHVDAGIGLIGDEVSYRDKNEFRAFCFGQDLATKVWEWVVLPPSNLIHRTS